MKTIAHISDLHFGTEDKVVVAALAEDIEMLNPDVLVVSGDLTQRARRNQYRSVALFLSQLDYPQIIVPGNHDMPLFDIFRRMANPLGRYTRYILNDLWPMYLDDEIVVLGMNTARPLAWKKGRISKDQIRELKRIMCSLSNEPFKILVTHHPFIPPPRRMVHDIISRAPKAIAAITECDIDLMLAGHLHSGYHGEIKHHYPGVNQSIIVSHAGTAVSRRRWREPNAYNIVKIFQEKFYIICRQFVSGRFTQIRKVTFFKRRGKWTEDWRK